MSRQTRRLFGALAVLAAVAIGWRCFIPGSTPRPKIAAPDTAPARDERHTISFVILPPDAAPEGTVGRGDDGRAQAVGLFCDLLAERLSKTPGITVVDRSHLDRILAERAINGPGQSPLLSYDAMVRVRLEGSADEARIAVEVIDLSVGNLAASGKWHWRPDSDEVAGKAADLCASTRHALAMGSGNRLKIRVLNATAVDKVARLEPLGQRLLTTFEEMLARSPQVCLVHHLEAATAKEESLLLLMGLSRLPEGRTFSPQADAALQFRLVEKQALGKTFEDTVIELACRLEKADASGEWLAVTGKASDWDDLVSAAWQRLSSQLASLDSDAAREVLHEMGIRRRQAEAELANTDAWTSRAYSHDTLCYVLPEEWVKPEYRRERLREITQVAAVAAKIDPTLEEAAYQYARFRYLLLATSATDADRTGFAAGLQEVVTYLKRFKGPAGHRTEILALACDSMFWHLWKYNSVGAWPVRAVPSGSTEHHCVLWAKSSPDAAKTVGLLREMLDLSLDEDAQQHQFWHYHLPIWVAYTGLLESGVAPDEAGAWRHRAYDKASRRLLPVVRPVRAPHGALHAFSLLRAEAVRWALDCGDHDRAAQLVRDFMASIEPPTLNSMFPLLAEQIERHPDRSLLEAFRNWPNVPRGDNTAKGKVVSLVEIKWPAPPADREAGERPTLNEPSWEYSLEGLKKGEYVRFRPVAIADRRLYVLYSRSTQEAATEGVSRLGYIALSPEGLPANNPDRLMAGLPVREGTTRDDMRHEHPVSGIHPLPQTPALAKRQAVTCSRLLQGRIFLATSGAGICVFDPRTDQWSDLAAKQGLPHLNVLTMHALDASRLLCIAGDSGEVVRFVVDVSTGQVRLLQRTADKRWLFLRELLGVWKVGAQWRGLCREGIIDDVLGAAPLLRPWPDQHPVGWSYADTWHRPPARGMAVVGKRRFVLSDDALREIDDDGRTLRSWHGWYNLWLNRDFTGQAERKTMLRIPPQMPFSSLSLAGATDKYLLLSVGGLICFDPEQDQWYGPVWVGGWDGIAMSPDSELLPSWGECLGMNCGVIRVSDLMDACRASRRSWSSQQLCQRQQVLLDASPPLDAAKHAIACRQFEKARGVLSKLLAAEPRNAQALLLLAWVHERPCLNDVPKALECYQRLEALEGDRVANLTGIYYQYLHHIQAGATEAALRLGKRMVAEFFSPLDAYPKGGLQIEVQARNSQLQAMLARQHTRRVDGGLARQTQPAVKQPPYGASNR